MKEEVKFLLCFFLFPTTLKNSKEKYMKVFFLIKILGSIKNHYKESHNMFVTKEKLIENTSILIKEHN